MHATISNTKPDNKKVANLNNMFALLIDEVSMLDTVLWGVMEQIMTLRQNTLTPGKKCVDGG